MRQNRDLKRKLEYYLINHFSDIKLKNQLFVKFGRKAKNQLGSIRQKNEASLITVTGLFKDPAIPDFVVESTLVHELIHYLHGFCSPLAKRYQYPHKHGIMRKEFEKRGLLNLHQKSKKWIKNNWREYLVKNGLLKQKRKRIKHIKIGALKRFVLKISKL